jgi:hypothetical protein
VSDSLVGARSSDELLKQALRERIIRHALRMPLNSYDPIGITGPFHGFDGAIRGVSGDAELFPGWSIAWWWLLLISARVALFRLAS